MASREELQKEIESKLARIEVLKARKPKKHCGHKEYSSAEDVAAAMELERLQDEVTELKARLAKQA